MKTVTFTKPYDHPFEKNGETGHYAYPAGFTGEVSNDVAVAAEAKSAVKAAKPPSTSPAT